MKHRTTIELVTVINEVDVYNEAQNNNRTGHCQ